MACGTPVVALRNGSVAEVVEDGVSGYVADDFGAFVEAVGRVGAIDPRACRKAPRSVSASTPRCRAMSRCTPRLADTAPSSSAGGHDPTAYGASIAEEYDELYEGVLDTETTVARLADLAGGGPILEMGIGTGRLALPLAARGLAVVGIEASPAMVDLLRSKPGADRISVTVGDFAEVVVPGPFALVVLAFNTVFALPSDEAQVACFANAARHLAPGGRFVVDAWVLAPENFVDGASVGVRYVAPDRLSLDTAVLRASPIDDGGQNVRTVQVVLSEGKVRLFPAHHRYAGPAELDLMARAAGLRLEHRWAGWDRTPFTAGSRAHVSVYRKPAAER